MAKNRGGANKTQTNIFIQHVEKIGLVATILLGAVFAWHGFSIEKLDERKSPEKLKEKSATIASFINEPSWAGEEGLSSMRSAPSDYPERVKKLQRPIISQNYETIMPFDPPTVGQTTRRSDPNLYAALDLRAVAITASLAYKQSAGVEDPTADDKDPTFEIIKKRKPKRTRTNSQIGFGDDEDGSDMIESDELEDLEIGDMGGDILGGGEGGGNVARLLPDQLIGFRPGSHRILESGTVVGIKGAGRATGMMGSTGSEESGMDIDEMAEDAGMDEGMDFSGMGEDSFSASSSVPQPSTVVAVVGVVPYKKQWDEYSRVLQGASGYEASRDKPRYVYLYGERVDVTDNPEREINEDEWERVTNFSQYRKETQKWDGSPKELVDEQYLDPFLTFVCPPIMMRDLTEMLSHDLIPLRNMPKQVAPVNEDELLDDDPENVPEDAPGGFVDRPEAGSDAGDVNSSRVMDDMQEDMMEDMMGGMGMGMMGGGRFNMPGRSIPEFMMVRFFDLTAEPGRVYRYRVRLLLEDPNHPNINFNTNYPQHIAPPARSLDEDVIARITQMEDPTHRIFFRETEWSEPTAPVMVPDPTRVFAGSVNYLATTPPLKNKQIPVQNNLRLTYVDREPKGTILPVVWDPIRGVDVPLRKEVQRGSMLNQSDSDVHYGHPASLLIRRITEEKFPIDLVVGDIRGGEDLPGTSRDYRVFSPGEFALIDSKGRLNVHNELDDMDGFKRYDFREQLIRDENTGSTAPGTYNSSESAFGLGGN